MGFEPGGRADKLGNRHEGRWVAKQLLRLLNEEINSIVIESIGDDERGVDLWVELKDGMRQAQQCKARNESKELWSINDLKAKGVLNHLQFQLDRDHRAEFVIVSGIPSRLLGDICDSSRNSLGSPEDFYRYQVQAIGKERNNAFRDFCMALNLNPEDEIDRVKAYNYIRRTRVELYPDDKNAWSDLLTRANFLLTGKPETILATLITYAENNDRLGNSIYPDELWFYLDNQGIYPKKLTYDTRIAPVIKNLQNEFADSIRQVLINGDLIRRKETEESLKAIEANSLVVLHGSAGSGKSGVLYELTHELEAKNIPYLSLRLDRRVPEKTAEQFGYDMGLPDSPVNCLVAIARERSCVLILDQLDAIRWTHTHSSNALDVCKELIRQVLSFRRDGKDITIVLSCRTFDLENDPEIRNWLKDQDMQQWKKIEVEFLPETSVREIVGVAYEKMNGHQRGILSNPKNLAMWVELPNRGDLPSINSATELMKKFWDFKRKQLESKGVNAIDINYILDVLVKWLEKNGKISAPTRILSTCSRTTIDLFKSLGIIHDQNNMVSFCHQSYLDFLIAEHLINEIEVGGNILDWLGHKEKQTLFRRGQLQQALALLAEDSLDHFLDSIKEIISADGVRFHLKHLILETIAQMDVISNLIGDYCITMLDDAYWRTHFLETVFYGHSPLLLMLIETGKIEEWLKSSNDEDTNRALLLLGSVAEKIPDNVTILLEPYVCKGDEWASRILNTICREVADDSNSMFELRLHLARSGNISNFIDWKEVCDKHSIRAIKLIEAILSTLDSASGNEQSTNKRRHFEEWNSEDLKALSQVAEQYSLETWDMLMPHVERLTSFMDSPYDQKIEKWHKER